MGIAAGRPPQGVEILNEGDIFDMFPGFTAPFEAAAGENLVANAHAVIQPAVQPAAQPAAQPALRTASCAASCVGTCRGCAR